MAPNALESLIKEDPVLYPVLQACNLAGGPFELTWGEFGGDRSSIR